MASYSYTYDATSVKITAKGLTSGDSVRFYCRLSDETTADYIDKTASGTSCSYTFTGLDPETSYTINVRVNGTHIGAKTFTTDAEEEESKTGFYIYYNGAWKKATPSLYYSGWKK